MHYRKSPSVARELKITYARLFDLLRSGRLAPPRRDESGHFIWTAADVQRVRKALKIDRRRKPVAV